MKRHLLTLAAAIAIGACPMVFAHGGGPGGHDHGFGLDGLTKTLNLTADQQAKVQPILDQARPQIIAVHQDAMQKTKAIHDNAISQIRPLLNADQQAKLDQIQKAHQDMANAAQEMHNARSK